MEKSAPEVWARLLEEARLELPEAAIRTWLGPSEPVAYDEGRLILSAPDQFAVEWNTTKHAPMLARLARQVFGTDVDVVFQVQARLGFSAQ